jgi:hypothetical protein
MTEVLFKAAKVPADDFFQAKRRVLQAEFELCQSDKERVEVLTKLAAVAKEIEGIVDQLVKSALVSPIDLLKAKANRLEAVSSWVL